MATTIKRLLMPIVLFAVGISLIIFSKKTRNNAMKQKRKPLFWLGIAATSVAGFFTYQKMKK